MNSESPTLDRIAYLRVELEEEAFLDQGAGVSAKVARRGCRNRFHRAVKWKFAAERADVHEPGGIAAWKNSHA